MGFFLAYQRSGVGFFLAPIAAAAFLLANVASHLSCIDFLDDAQGLRCCAWRAVDVG
jgi:hypothetical protein